MIRGLLRSDRRWLAPEVVQTSSMDCGPAALKCVLDGYNRPVSYGRLREACQTDIDGTSIDTSEDVAEQLGLSAEQVMIPVDHVCVESAAALPAIAVVRHAEMATHFVVVWQRIGPWLQIMDPARGRRWVSAKRFEDELFRHEHSVEAPAWREWARTVEFIEPLAERLAELGIEESEVRALIEQAFREPSWFHVGALDSAARLTKSLVRAGGIRPGHECAQVLRTMWSRTCESSGDIYSLIPADYWSVNPDASNIDPTREMLRLNGVVLLRIRGMRKAPEPERRKRPISRELEAALTERSTGPLKTIWKMLAEDGLLSPLVLAAVMVLSTCVIMAEALLFRGVFDISAFLRLPIQRLVAALALLGIVITLAAIEIPLVLESLRLGRRLEARFRMALLRKLPRLTDRYFQSRPITDMADRNHNIHLLRNFPSMGLQFVQSLTELALTFFGIALIEPSYAWLAGLLVFLATIIPLAIQPLLNERDLRVRTHGAALHGFYLDALLGLAPVRAHRAERSVSRQHEGLLVEWAHSMQASIRLGLASGALQSALCSSLAGAFMIAHFVREGGVSGSDLLLVFWILRLPAIGSRIAGLATQYPVQRNVLLRLMEPLDAPEDLSPSQALPGPANDQSAATAITLNAAAVVAGGHEILRDISVTIEPGEHVAIVGPSGAGKSSILGVLLGWHRLATGQLLVDGCIVEGNVLDHLRGRCAWVDPSVQIWNRSLLENLEYATEQPMLHRVGDVLESARLREVSEKLPHGLQSMLGESGGQLSGGEGQRVRLGRALCMPAPRLVLLDEPFRGLDRGQRHEMLLEARKWWKDATLLCVTHDVNETRHFDRVLVVEGGRIVEDGAPENLAKADTRYRDLLQAEKNVFSNIWRSDSWRRLLVKGGGIVEGEVQP